MFISPFIYTIYQPTNDHGTLLRAAQREETRAPKRKGDIGDRVDVILLPLKYRSSDKDTRGSSIGVGMLFTPFTEPELRLNRALRPGACYAWHARLLGRLEESCNRADEHAHCR